MKKKYYVALCIVIILTLSIFVAGYNSVLDKDSNALKLAELNFELKDFKTEDLKANEYTKADFPKGIVVVEVFASWCIPCRDSFPEFVKFQNENKDPNVSVVGIAYDDVSFEIEKFMKEYGTLNTIFKTNVATKDAFKLRSVPQTLFVKDNNIIYKVYGSMKVKDIEDVVKLVKEKS